MKTLAEYRLRLPLCIGIVGVLLLGCGPSAIELENHALKQENDKLRSEIAAQDLSSREKFMKLEESKIESEKEKLQLMERIQELNSQIAQLTSVAKITVSDVPPAVDEWMNAAYVEDLVPDFSREIDSGLRLKDALESCPFLVNHSWDVLNERTLHFSADVDSTAIAGREALKDILVAAMSRITKSSEDYTSDLPGGRLISSFVQKAASYSVGSIAENVPDSYLASLQDIISTYVPPYRIAIEFSVAPPGRTRSQKFVVTTEQGSLQEILIPESSYQEVLVDIATNESPITMTALMLNEFGLIQVKNLAISYIESSEPTQESNIASPETAIATTEPR